MTNHNHLVEQADLPGEKHDEGERMQMLIESPNTWQDEDENLHVLEKFGCPRCYETEMDYLIWQSDGKYVKCIACGKKYMPGHPEYILRSL